MSFYRKEQARNVRGFCCPRPLPASSRSPSFHPFSGPFFLPSLFSPTHGSSLLSACVSREMAVDRQKPGFCRDYFAERKVPRHQYSVTEVRIYTRERRRPVSVDWKGRLETTWWHGRGSSHERARDGRKFDAAVVVPGKAWKRSLASAGLSSVQHKGNCCAVPECFRASESFSRVVRFVVESIVPDYSLFRKSRWTAQWRNCGRFLKKNGLINLWEVYRIIDRIS